MVQFAVFFRLRNDLPQGVIMDALTFIANVINSLVWPLTVIIVLIVLRRPIAEVIPLLQTLRWKDIELNFETKIKQIESQAEQENLPMKPERILLPAPRTIDEMVENLLTVSPQLGIVEAFAYVEKSIREAAPKHGLPQNMEINSIVNRLRERTILSDGIVQLYYQLKRLRDYTSHTTAPEVSQEQAHRYVEQALRLANAIGSA